MLRITCGRQYENLAKSTIMYKIETDLKEDDQYIHGTLYDQDGIFGFVNWLSKILLLSLSEEDVLIIPADMFIFNLEICAPLVKIFKYGTDSYPWVEAMIYNFSKAFKRIWTTPNSRDWHRTEEFVTPVKSKQNKKDLTLTQSVIPRFHKAEVCCQCHKRIAKTPKLFPVCFQGCDIQSFPREIARLERPESEWDEPVSRENILTSRRNTVLVCSARCMLHAMAQMNKSLYQICVFIPKEMERKELVKECFERMGMSENDYQSYLTFSDEEKDNVLERGIKQMIREIKKNIMYSNLRWIVESVYPQGQLKVINSKLEVDNKARMKKETLLTVKSTTTTNSKPFEDCEKSLAAKAKRDIPSNITDYISHLLLHSNKETSCQHNLMWGGWAKYHPVNEVERYIEQRGEDGFSKTCIDFQLKIETCDQIDLKLMVEEEREKLQQSLKEMNMKTVHLFPLVLLEHYAVSLRDKCYKVALSGPSNLDDVAMDKVFSSSNAILGLWDPFQKKSKIPEYKGVIICRSPKTYFAFIPHPNENIIDLFSSVTQYDLSKDFLSEMMFARKLNIIYGLSCLSKCKDFDDLQEEARDNIMFLTFSLATMDAIGRRGEFEHLVKGNGLCEMRFNALHLHKHHSCLNTVLYESSDTNLIRYSPKHLIGCPHELIWTGNLIFSGNVYRHKVSAWAYTCRCLSEKMMLKSQAAQQTIPRTFIKDLQIKNIEVYVFSSFHITEQELESPYNSNLILFDLGSIPERLADDIKNPDSLVVSALCVDEETTKHFIRFCHIDGHIYGKIIPERDSELYSNYIRDGIKEYDPAEFDGKMLIRQDPIKFFDKRWRGHAMINCINKDAEPFSARCLWVGEMQCLIIGDQVLGFEMDKQLMEVARTDDHHAVMASNDEDIGAIRNGPILASTGHYAYSNYVAITPSRKSNMSPNNEAFFNKARETGVSLVAINVDRRVIENIIGTFKKCSEAQVHAQDGFYLQSELRDTKTTLLAFFLERDEHVLDVLKLPASEAAKRFWILKHDNKEDKLSLYCPKEIDKMEQIWKSFSKSALMTTHEKMFKKLRKYEKQQVSGMSGLQIKTVLTPHPDPSKGDVVSVIAEPIAQNQRNAGHEKKATGKKDSKQTLNVEKSSEKQPPNLSNVNQNLKNMFLQDSEKEKNKVGSSAGGASGGEKKICWNCHASEAEHGVRLLKCESCKKARYCGTVCQEEDWDRHREFCLRKQERRKQREIEKRLPKPKMDPLLEGFLNGSISPVAVEVEEFEGVKVTSYKLKN